VRTPQNTKVKEIHLLVSDRSPNYETRGNIVSLTVPSILDHEVVALDIVT